MEVLERRESGLKPIPSLAMPGLLSPVRRRILKTQMIPSRLILFQNRHLLCGVRATISLTMPRTMCQIEVSTT